MSSASLKSGANSLRTTTTRKKVSDLEWEYKILRVQFDRTSNNDDVVESGLNKLGAEGWELTAVILPFRSATPIYYFKRQKEGDA